DLPRIDRAALPLVIDVLEQMLTRYFLTAAHDFGDAPVIDENFVRHAALAAEVQHRAPVAYEGDMAVTQRGEAKAFVVAGVLGIADANARGVEQRDHDGQHLLARQARQAQVTLENAA